MKTFSVWYLSLLVCGLSFAGCSSEDPEENVAQDPPKPVVSQPKPAAENLPLPVISTRELDIHTAESGFHVFVNGYPARKADGKFLLTPCRVSIPNNVENVTITVAKEDAADATQTVWGSEQSEMTFGKSQPVNELVPSVLNLPLVFQEKGQPVALFSLNSSQSELDPYVEPNGLVMWFVGDRAEGKAIYRAERKSRYDLFSSPKIQLPTQSGRVPASPSVSETGALVYAVPEKSQIVSVTKTGEAWDRPERLRFSTRSNITWETAQILPDGLTLYWTEKPDGSDNRHGLRSTRTSWSEPFKTTEDFPLPGGHPCLSSDGLRQYVFDGKILMRARRQFVKQRFSPPEPIATLDLPDYQPNPERRLFWVSEDEEWLYYSANVGAGDLYAVRIFNGPGWGYAPRGEPIAAKITIADVKPVDPGSLPFIPPEIKEEPKEQGPPYPKFRVEFAKLLKDREYNKATESLEAARKNPRFQHDLELLKWDQEELGYVTGFWDSVRKHMAEMTPGTPFRIGATKVNFVKFEKDVIHFRLSKDGTKELTEMRPRDMIALIAPNLTRENFEGQMQAAMFLYYDDQGDKKQAQTRLEEAGKLGQLFQDRIPGRVLHAAKRELKEARVSVGLALLESILKDHKDSSSASVARTLMGEIYRQVEWNPTGSRKWENPEPGTYLAGKSRQERSYLLSPDKYRYFELRSEWKITEPGGSGGVFFRYGAPGRDDPYRKAFKLQLADDRDFKPDPQSTGALHTYEAPSENASKPRGEWNTLRLRVRNLNVEVWINDKKVLETIAQNDLVPLEGYVALDGVTGGIAYRKTLLVELSPTVE